MYPQRQIFLVFGLSRSGQAAASFLLSQKAVVYIYDEGESERIAQTTQTLSDAGAKVLRKEELSRVASFCDVLVLSPGIPVDHFMAVAFKRSGKAVIGETELAARYIQTPVIAVTGTNGKTTVVSMLTDVLNKGGLSAKACGNIGVPMSECLSMREKIAVAEISSFQLETLRSLRPHIAVVLNVTEDHLNRHYNMENYVYLKSKLLKNSTEAEFVVLNYDDAVVRSFAEKTKAQTLYFSVRERVKGAFYEDGYLYFGKERIMSADDLSAGGLHNVQNALAVIVAAKIMGIKTDDIASALGDFKGVKHRIEQVAEADGVTYIDDSKGTNADATLKAVACMQKETVLLLGGKDKGYRYEPLFEALRSSKVVHAILYGENRFALLRAAEARGFTSVTLCDSLEFATRVAMLRAHSGQNVLLSPASASFDEFSGYEERGERFAEIVCGGILHAELVDDREQPPTEEPLDLSDTVCSGSDFPVFAKEEELQAVTDDDDTE